MTSGVRGLRMYPTVRSGFRLAAWGGLAEHTREETRDVDGVSFIGAPDCRLGGRFWLVRVGIAGLKIRGVVI
jgi:hypothetical protein